MYGYSPYRGFESHPLRQIKLFRHSDDKADARQKVIANRSLTKASCHYEEAVQLLGGFFCMLGMTGEYKSIVIVMVEEPSVLKCWNCVRVYFVGGGSAWGIKRFHH